MERVGLLNKQTLNDFLGKPGLACQRELICNCCFQPSPLSRQISQASGPNNMNLAQLFPLATSTGASFVFLTQIILFFSDNYSRFQTQLVLFSGQHLPQGSAKLTNKITLKMLKLLSLSCIFFFICTKIILYELGC